ncbi:MAG: alginate lyase family protein [Aquisalimonadaceae bacterium]
MLRFARTVRYLRMEQVLWRVWYRVRRVRPRGEVDLPRAITGGPWVAPVAPDRRMVGPRTFEFLNHQADVSGPAAWNAPSVPKLWLYNLHYFEDLLASGAADRVDWHRDYIARWIAENPPGSGNGWEPYPTSLRIVSWIKWALAGNTLTEEARRSLGLQVHWLRRNLEYHILGNHLFANAKALIFAGLFFEGREPDEWLRKGFALLCRELPEQVLEDGGHFERSPMYHLIVVEDCLDLMNILRAYGVNGPLGLEDAAHRMLAWGEVMAHPDGGVPFFNDAALGIAPAIATVSAYAVRLGLHRSEARKTNPVIYLRDSGYVAFRNADLTAFFDIAPVGPDYLPGHAHADTLSVEVSIGDQRLLVNSGTSLYEAGDERNRQRGTGAHNTVMIDGEDSSEVWAGFRVARRAYVRDVDVSLGAQRAAASHEGYQRLRGRPVHRRQVVLEDGCLEITDDVTGLGEHALELRWHLHPDVEVKQVRRVADRTVLTLAFGSRDDERQVRLAIAGVSDCVVESTTYHPAFGISRDALRVVARLSGALPRSFVTRVEL